MISLLTKSKEHSDELIKCLIIFVHLDFMISVAQHKSYATALAIFNNVKPYSGVHLDCLPHHIVLSFYLLQIVNMILKFKKLSTSEWTISTKCWPVFFVFQYFRNSNISLFLEQSQFLKFHSIGQFWIFKIYQPFSMRHIHNFCCQAFLFLFPTSGIIMPTTHWFHQYYAQISPHKSMIAHGRI